MRAGRLSSPRPGSPWRESSSNATSPFPPSATRTMPGLIADTASSAAGTSPRGYAVFLLSTDGSIEATREAIGRVIGLKMDGAFISLGWAMSRPEAGVERLIERGIAVVGVSGGSYDLAGVDCFLNDEEGGGSQIGTYLHRLGHRQVLFVGPVGSRAAEKRYSGLASVFGGLAKGDGTTLEQVPTQGYTASAAYDAVQSALSHRQHFTAMVAFNDAVATGALSDNGLVVPDDVSFVSFGSDHRDFARPRITSVTFEEERIAALAANCLIDRIKGTASGPSSHEYLPLTLTVRESSKRTRGASARKP